MKNSFPQSFGSLLGSKLREIWENEFRFNENFIKTFKILFQSQTFSIAQYIFFFLNRPYKYIVHPCSLFAALFSHGVAILLLPISSSDHEFCTCFYFFNLFTVEKFLLLYFIQTRLLVYFIQISLCYSILFYSFSFHYLIVNYISFLYKLPNKV